MKKTILSTAVITAAIFTASCQKENLQGNTTSEGSASVFTATIETVAGTKTTVERVDGTEVIYKTKWESTDQISINGVTYTATPDDIDATKATFTKVSGEDPTGTTFKAYFPATMYSNGKAILPASYTYADGKYNMPMYAQNGTTSLSFRNLCGVLAITVKGEDFTSVSSIEVSSDKQMNGEFTATAAGVLTFASKTLADADKKVALNFASAKTIASDGSATFYIPVPAGTHNPLTIKVSDGSTTKTMVTKKSGGVAVERKTVYPIAFAGSSLPAGALPGEFTVNADGKKVHFSQGNLFWDGDSYEFEANQYDIGTWNATNHVNYFFWSNDASVAKNASYSDGSAAANDVLFTNQTAITAKSDFTVGGVAGKFRTLSAEEWTYILSGRTNAENLLSEDVTIFYFNQHCLVIAPDVCLNSYVFDKTKKSYDLTEWATAEDAGLVCLPPADYRDDAFVISGEYNGFYWASTTNDAENASNFGFKKSDN